jgi:hypothetical protein
MRRIVALIVLWAGLLGAATPVFACTSSGANGDCCPPGAPAGCGHTTEQFDLAATTCCLTGGAPSPMVSAEPGREQQIVDQDGGSPDPIAIVSALISLPRDAALSCGFAATTLRPAATDLSRTYLHTGRLRL